MVIGGIGNGVYFCNSIVEAILSKRTRPIAFFDPKFLKKPMNLSKNLILPI
jgi:hypothetical protein